MAEKRLRRLDRLSRLHEQSRMCMPERVPSHARLFESITSGASAWLSGNPTRSEKMPPRSSARVR